MEQGWVSRVYGCKPVCCRWANAQSSRASRYRQRICWFPLSPAKNHRREYMCSDKGCSLIESLLSGVVSARPGRHCNITAAA